MIGNLVQHCRQLLVRADGTELVVGQLDRNVERTSMPDIHDVALGGAIQVHAV